MFAYGVPSSCQSLNIPTHTPYLGGGGEPVLTIHILPKSLTIHILQAADSLSFKPRYRLP